MSMPRLPVRGAVDEIRLHRVTETINGIIDGKIDVVGSVTLTAGATTTTVTDNKFESTMALQFTPTTANAAGALGGLYVSSRGEGTFTLTHANTGTTDRTFLYTRLG